MLKLTELNMKRHFEFPIKSDNEFVGVKFAASAMPLSPSARIKIDYDSAKKKSEMSKKETTTQKKPLPLQLQRQQQILQRQQQILQRQQQITTTTTTTTTAPNRYQSLKRKRLKMKKVPIAIACGVVGAVAFVLVMTAVIKKNKHD